MLDTGCQDMAPGNNWFLSEPFNRICTFEHNNDSYIFNQPENVSYATGPAHTGDPLPWSTRWAAWTDSVGIKVAKIAHVDPGSGVGNYSSLYPNTRPDKLALGFTSIGQMAIAIEQNDQSIEIKWFKDDSGTIESIGVVSFPGQSPVLFNNGLVAITDDVGVNDLMLYYIRPSQTRRLYLRIEREHFTIEHLVNDNIQVEIETLKSSEEVGGKQLLYARDSFGRDITFYSPEYAVNISGDEITLETGFTSGDYADIAENADAGSDRGTLALAFSDGLYHNPIETTGTLSTDAATLTPAFTEGEYL